jgi:hypothetical protein
MTPSRSKHLWIPMIAISLTFGSAAVVHAQDASLSVTFGHSPHWVGVRGTRVREIRTSDRPDYDMFSYGGSYYAYNNNHWYSSRRSRGNFRSKIARSRARSRACRATTGTATRPAGAIRPRPRTRPTAAARRRTRTAGRSDRGFPRLLIPQGWQSKQAPDGAIRGLSLVVLGCAPKIADGLWPRK